MINYYTILEISKNSDEETIRSAIKNKRRTWTQRSSHPSLEIRAEAEKMVNDITEAELILLDVSKRKQYDADLESSASQPAPTTVPQEATRREKKGEKLSALIYYLENNDYDSASYVVDDAIAEFPDDAVVWHFKGEVCEHFGNYSEAQFAYNEAIRRDPNDMTHIFDLARIFYKTERYQEALTCYVKIQETDSSYFKKDQFLDLRIRCLMGLKRYKIGMPLIRDFYERCPNNQSVAELYAAFLHSTIYNSWSELNDECRTITNYTQYQFTQYWIGILIEIPLVNNQLRNMIIDLNKEFQRLSVVSYEDGAGSNAADAFFEGSLLTGTIGALASLGGTAARGKKMRWEWEAMYYPQYVLQSGMQFGEQWT